MASAVDPVVGIAQALSIVIGATAAAALAPHLVVLISGLAGGVVGLMSWRKCSIAMGALYVLGMGAMAWLFAGSLAELLSIAWPALSDRRLLSPIALLIGAIGHRWPGVARWALGLGRTLIESAIKREASK
jgi:hypothetical protein